MERRKKLTNETLMLGLEAFRSDAHLQVNKRLLKIFGLELAVYISNLCDKQHYFMERELLTEDGGFFLTHEQQMDQTGMSEHQLRKCKKKLKELEVLTTQMRGIPPKEFYFLDLEKLINKVSMNYPLNFKGINPKNLKELTPKNLRNIKDNKLKDNKYNKNKFSFSDPAGSDEEIDDNPSSNNTNKPSLQERNKEYIPYASKLAEIIQSNKNVKINGSKIKSWANEIRKLVESDRVNPTRIDTALNWYQENIGGDYIPVVESGASFRNKFIRLEDAIKRNNGSHSNNVPNESNHESPEEIIAQEFQKDRIAQIFIRCCFLPAKKILTQTSNGQLPELARNLIDLRRYIHAEQKENRGKFSDMEQANIFPSPTGLIEDYIDWIQDNHWIEDKEPRLFTSRHKIFQKFLNYQRKLQNDRHPLTGE